MTQEQGGTVERGAAEENSGTPLTETEAEVSERPPSEPDPVREHSLQDVDTPLSPDPGDA